MVKRARAAKNSKLLVTWEQALEQFLLWKLAQGRAPRTIQDYRYHVNWFFSRYPELKLDDEHSLRLSVVEYMAVQCKPAYYNLKLASLRGFFEFCRVEGYVSINPTEGLKRRRAEGRTVNIDTGLLKQILALPDQTTFVGVRDYALLLLQLDTGIRPKEALMLLLSDVTIGSSEVRVRADNAKTRQGRTVYISPITVKAIMKLVHSRLEEWDETVPLFCTYEGRSMVSNRWYKRLSAYGKNRYANEEFFQAVISKPHTRVRIVKYELPTARWSI